MTGWQEMIGHEWAVQMLAGSIRYERVGHAYLLTGPDQIGKTTLARIFAQALNCTAAPAARPCGQCRACTLIAADRHPDVRLVLPEVSDRGKMSIKIERIRTLLQDITLSPYEGRMKIAILKRFDTANLNAANAFLKTLEEPPNNVVLLLTANDADTLLPTIASRCRVVNLRPLSRELIAASLATRWGVESGRAELLASLADGRLGWAVQAATDPELLALRETHLEQLHAALEGSCVDRFQLAELLARKPEALPEMLKSWLSWWRDINLLLQQGDGRHAVPITNVDQQDQMNIYRRRWNRQIALASLQQTDTALWQLARNGNTHLVLENLFLTFPPPARA